MIKNVALLTSRQGEKMHIIPTGGARSQSFKRRLTFKKARRKTPVLERSAKLRTCKHIGSKKWPLIEQNERASLRRTKQYDMG